MLILKWKMNISNEPFITFLAPMCLQCCTRVESSNSLQEYQMALATLQSELTPFSIDGVIKAYKFSPGPKKNAGLQGAKSRSWSPVSQVWGAQRGARPQPGRPRKYPHHWGSTNWPQTPPGLWEDGMKKKKEGERKTRDGVDCWESCGNYHLQWRQCSRELRPGTCSCEIHDDWCARVAAFFNYNRSIRLIFIHEREIVLLGGF